LLLLLTAGRVSADGPRLGIQGGVQAAGLTFRSSSPLAIDHDLQFRPSWSAGIQVVLPVSIAELETGVRYVEYGDRFDFHLELTGFGTTEAWDIEDREVWRYVTVPLLVRVRPMPARGFFVSAGPEIGYLLTVWDKMTVTRSVEAGAMTHMRSDHPARPAARIFEEVGTFDDHTGYYRRWNVSLCAAAGIEFPIGGHHGEAQLRYAHGVSDIAKSATLTRATRGLELLTSLRW
jgi:hypothetical protein